MKNLDRTKTEENAKEAIRYFYKNRDFIESAETKALVDYLQEQLNIRVVQYSALNKAKWYGEIGRTCDILDDMEVTNRNLQEATENLERLMEADTQEKGYKAMKNQNCAQKERHMQILQDAKDALRTYYADLTLFSSTEYDTVVEYLQQQLDIYAHQFYLWHKANAEMKLELRDDISDNMETTASEILETTKELNDMTKIDTQEKGDRVMESMDRYLLENPKVIKDAKRLISKFYYTSNRYNTKDIENCVSTLQHDLEVRNNLDMSLNEADRDDDTWQKGYLHQCRKDHDKQIQITTEKMAELMYKQDQVNNSDEVNSRDYHIHENGGGLVYPTAKVDPSTFVAPFAVVKKGATVQKNSFIGPGSKIGAWSNIGEHTVIRKDCRIGESVKLGDNVKVGDYTEIGAETVIRDNVTIYQKTTIKDSCSLWNNVTIYTGCYVGSEVRLEPETTLYSGSTITCGVNADDTENNTEG